MCKNFTDGAGAKYDILLRLMWVVWRMDKASQRLLNLVALGCTEGVVVDLLEEW